MSDRIAVMSAGELQQLGGAQEIYEQPHNMFVADFIGETNLLEVSVDAIADGAVMFQLDGGHALSCVAVDGVKAGASVHVSIRPERLYLSEVAVESDSLPGRVRDNVFVGTDIQTMVDVHNGPSMMVRTSNSSRGNERLFETGSPVFVNIEAGAARLLVD